jgi:glyoxylase-like metal-dependent hydrolase (beta-lactamase superfamily II)
MPLTKKGDVFIVPTPGHTPHHVSVVVCGSPSFFVAGDNSNKQRIMLEGRVDGVSPNMDVTRRTLKQIVRLAEEQPLVYLPSHDPESINRLAQRSVLRGAVKNIGDFPQVSVG